MAVASLQAAGISIPRPRTRWSPALQRRECTPGALCDAGRAASLQVLYPRSCLHSPGQAVPDWELVHPRGITCSGQGSVLLADCGSSEPQRCCRTVKRVDVVSKSAKPQHRCRLLAVRDVTHRVAGSPTAASRSIVAGAHSVVVSPAAASRSIVAGRTCC